MTGQNKVPCRVGCPAPPHPSTLPNGPCPICGFRKQDNTDSAVPS